MFGPLIGWSFIAAGLSAWLRPPSRRFGTLLVVTGFAWFLGVLTLIDQPLVWTLGLAVGSLWLAVLVQALVAFPSGRLVARAERVVVGGAYAVLVAAWLPLILLTPDVARSVKCDGCPESALAVADVRRVGEIYADVRPVGFALVFGALCVLLVRRWRRSSPRERRAP